jgi:hypothetical protein
MQYLDVIAKSAGWSDLLRRSNLPFPKIATPGSTGLAMTVII